MSEVDVPSPKSATVEILVRVLDVNDNDPVFPAASYDVTFPEGDGRREVIRVRLALFISYLSRHLR